MTNSLRLIRTQGSRGVGWGPGDVSEIAVSSHNAIGEKRCLDDTRLEIFAPKMIRDILG